MTRRLSVNPFDDIDLMTKQVKPLWTVKDLSSETDVLTWCNDAVDVCKAYYRDYFQMQMDNVLIYRGMQWSTQDRHASSSIDRTGVPTRRSPKLVINNLFDITESWVSKLTRFRPAVAIYPTNVEQSDVDDAKISRDVLDHIWYQQKIDQINAKLARYERITGEGFLFITWDYSKGDISPDYLAAKKESMRLGLPIPLTNEQGEAVLGADGAPLSIDKAVRVGDLRYDVVPPWRVFEQPSRDKDRVDWVIVWDVEDVDTLKARYPDSADKIRATASNDVFTDHRLDIGKFRNEVVIYTLYHRSSEFLDSGRQIRFTKDVVLENIPLPYQHGKLPYQKFQTIDLPESIRGMSIYQVLFPVAHQINACASLIYKALVLYAHPKIAAPDGSVDVHQLLNESTIAFYSGGVPPTMLNMPHPPQELFQYLEKLERMLQKLSTTYPLSQGEAPSGVRAAKALRLLEEQEDKRSHIINMIYNDVALIGNANMTLATAGQFYSDSDGRLARIVGQNNEYRIREFKAANLSKPYDIRIENTTALSRSPSARIEEVTELAQIRLSPDSPVTREQFIEFLEFGNAEQFKDMATKAVRAARAENDDMTAGEQIPAPNELEDHINHWKEHTAQMQGRDFKLLPPERVEAYKEHLYTTEYLMYEKAFGIIDPMGRVLRVGNEMFKQQLLLSCPSWPLLFKIPAPGMLPAIPPTGDPSQVPGNLGAAFPGQLDQSAQAQVPPGGVVAPAPVTP